MLTRRSFLGTVAALAVSPVASKAAPVALPEVDQIIIQVGPPSLQPLPVLNVGPMEVVESVRWSFRDDGDTILELR